VIGCDGDVRCDSDTESATESDTIDPGDDRLRVLHHGPKEPDERTTFPVVGERLVDEASRQVATR
jgi:uncharacterized cupin superfamily protein